MEIIVDPETNTWYTVGDRGAEFRNIPKGALVFNAAQTRELLTSGHISSRAGNSMVSGNAAANVKGTDGVGGSNNSTSTKQTFMYVVRTSSGSYKAVKLTGSSNWARDKLKSSGYSVVQDFTYSSWDSCKEYAHWMNVNRNEELQRQAQQKAQKAKSGNTQTKKNTSGSGSTQKSSSDIVSSIGWFPSIGESSDSSSTSGDYGGGYDDYGSADDDYIDPIDELTEAYKNLNEELDHAIQHQLYYYDVANRALNYNGMEKSLEEQAKIYKIQMQRAQDGIDELISQGVSDTDERLQQVEEMYWTAHRNLWDVYDKINALYVEGLNNQIDSLQSAFDNLSNVADSLSKNEVIDVDTFQTLLDNGIQYLDYIEKVGDQYVVNQEAVENMLKAEKEQLAVQTAISYLQRIYEAATDGSMNKIRELANATQTIGNNAWYSVDAMLNELSMMGTIPSDLISVIYKNVEKLKDLTGAVVMDTKEAEKKADEILDHLEDQERALDKIVDLTEDMIRSEVDEHIKAIQKEVDLFKEIVNLKRESLDKTREEDSYQRDVNDKLKEIADLRTKIDRLSLDDSRTAQAERMSLMDELAEKQRELSDFQSDHSYNAQVEALDKMAEDYEKERQGEIEALEESISSSEKLFRLAIDRIESRWDTLYEDLIEWNTATGNVLNSEITDNWNLAYEAAQKYWNYVDALKGTHQELLDNDRVNETLKYRVEDIFGPLSKSEKESGGAENIPNAVKQGVEDGLAAMVEEQGIVTIGGFVPRYHGGGVVDDRGSLNPKEAMAILQKGEVVLDKDEQKSLFRLIDLKNFLSEKLGHVIGDITVPARRMVDSLSGHMFTPALAGMSNNQAIDFRPEINVNIQHSGSMTDADARRYGSTIADTALDKLYSTFERRGISNIFSGKLKG